MSNLTSVESTVTLLAILTAGTLQLRPAQADWPTYRGDNQRSGMTAERIELPLVEHWTHRAELPPQPAWPEGPARVDVYRKVPLGPTVVFDRALHVVAHKDRIYYGSSADDSVTCLDAATGGIEWTFTTEGPVRLAPAVAGGKVYAGSDDGYVYCLDAADARLLWKHRVGPQDRRLPGNGRLISLWPVRCGLVVDAGTVYVCAGLFPSQGAYLCAGCRNRRRGLEGAGRHLGPGIPCRIAPKTVRPHRPNPATHLPPLRRRADRSVSRHRAATLGHSRRRRLLRRPRGRPTLTRCR